MIITILAWTFGLCAYLAFASAVGAWLRHCVEAQSIPVPTEEENHDRSQLNL